MSNLYLRAAGKFLQFPPILALLVFLPAGTLYYWQGWLFSAVLVGNLPGYADYMRRVRYRLLPLVW